MKLQLACIGRLKAGPEKELFERYWTRLEATGRRIALAPLLLAEYPESRADAAFARQREEGERLLKVAAGGTIALFDERGAAIDSAAFAAFVRKVRDGGAPLLSCVLGGPDGHSPELRARADAVFSFGAMTLPHGLARVVLAEQLYRAATIISGHPYHRA